MNRAGELYAAEEYFVTDLLLCSDAMYSGLDVLKPRLERTAKDEKKKAVIGVVEGDTHDIGKNLVKIMLETAGFEVFDLGRDVPLPKFVETAKQENVDLICLSTLMTTTMAGMKTVVNLLKEADMRDKIKVIIGGGPVSQQFSDKIGADGYSPNAIEAVKLAKKVLQMA
jgi:methylmalonyl-CoA mutase cobalamin-binding domain/chain